MSTEKPKEVDLTLPPRPPEAFLGLDLFEVGQAIEDDENLFTQRV